MNTSLLILFSLGPQVLPGQPSNVECTPWKGNSTIEGGEKLEKKWSLQHNFFYYKYTHLIMKGIVWKREKEPEKHNVGQNH